MAEFKDVHRNMVRMCDAMRAEDNGCAPCPLDGICAKFITLSEDAIAMIERVVTQWAAEHPEPVYPNWEEGWRQLFPESTGTPCPADYGKKYRNTCCLNSLCVNCRQRPMPAEVAEKLGIKPTITQEHAIKHNCDNCKYARRKSTDEPCVRCKQCIDCEESVLTAPDLWEAAK